MTFERDDAQRLTHEDDDRDFAARMAAQPDLSQDADTFDGASEEQAPTASPTPAHIQLLREAERALERMLVTAPLMHAPDDFAEKVMQAIRDGRAQSRRRRWFRFF